MARKEASVIFLIVLISFTCAQSNIDATTPVPEVIVNRHSTTSTSTVAPDSTTTDAPDTTTFAPDTTTVAPKTTTTVAPDTTTTVTPDTTTVAPRTTTIAPTPTPVPSPPEYRKWSYPENKNGTCVIVQLAVQLNLTYTNSDGKPTNALYNVPVNGTSVATGSCGKDKQSITVQWGQKSLMMLEFTSNNSQFLLSEIALSINATDVFEHAAANQTIKLYHAKDEFATAVAMSYYCNKIQTIGFTSTEDGKDVVANATISHVQFEAFHKQNNDQFSTARDCEAIDTPDIVPIAVGCALAALVIVVLIAYLVGRRRAQARGYLSM